MFEFPFFNQVYIVLYSPLADFIISLNTHVAFPGVAVDSAQVFLIPTLYRKNVQVGKDQEKAQSEKDSRSKNRGGKKTN